MAGTTRKKPKTKASTTRDADLVKVKGTKNKNGDLGVVGCIDDLLDDLASWYGRVPPLTGPAGIQLENHYLALQELLEGLPDEE